MSTDQGSTIDDFGAQFGRIFYPVVMFGLAVLGHTASTVAQDVFPWHVSQPSVAYAISDITRSWSAELLVNAELTTFRMQDEGRPLEFSFGVQLGSLSSTRRSYFGITPGEARRLIGDINGGPSTDIVIGLEAKGRVTTDTGDLLGKSLNALNVRKQLRNPCTTNLKIRGSDYDQISPNGSYWVPARYDLDTMLSKIDSRSVRDVLIIKGPYSVRYGPGFNFVDIELLGSPRYASGFDYDFTSSLEYKTNGEQWYGRQTGQTGGEDWGFRFSYGHRTGNDYHVGQGTAPPAAFPLLPTIPSSYNSRHVEAAIGFDIGENQQIEFSYLRLDQTGVEFPGLVFDINSLTTEAFELAYSSQDQLHFDRLQLETWYNRTRFDGNTLGIGKNRQIPTLRCNLFPFDGSGNPANIDNCVQDTISGISNDGEGTAITDVDQLSTGFRTLVSWGDPDCSQVSCGVDLRFIAQELNDIENERPPGSSNFPIPPSYSANPGFFLDYIARVRPEFVVRTGGRLDWVFTDAENNLPNVNDPISDLLLSDLPQEFSLWSAFISAEYACTDQLTLLAGAGYGQRPPTLTELYAAGSFIGVLQTGLTAVTGDPQLKPERNAQFDLGLVYETDRFHATANAFYSHIENYITFDARDLPDTLLGQRIYRVIFTNTELASLWGFELYGAYDVKENLTAFATLSYVEGRDHTRADPSRRRVVGDRSDVSHPAEPLPGIPPLESRVGLRLSQPCDNPDWGVELSARIAAAQTRFADSLGERGTEGFVVGDLRAYWRPAPRLLLIGGVENFADTLYREHLDYRSGRGVFQPGVNFYMSTEFSY